MTEGGPERAAPRDVEPHIERAEAISDVARAISDVARAFQARE